MAPRTRLPDCPRGVNDKSYLRALRAAEMAAWQAPVAAPSPAPAIASEPSPESRRESAVIKLLAATAALVLLQTLWKQALLGSLLDWIGGVLN